MHSVPVTGAIVKRIDTTGGRQQLAFNAGEQGCLFACVEPMNDHGEPDDNHRAYYLMGTPESVLDTLVAAYEDLVSQTHELDELFDSLRAKLKAYEEAAGKEQAA